MEIGKVFDEIQDNYTAKIARWVPFYHQLVGAIPHYLPATLEPKSILDLGCGNGNITYAVSKKFPEATYHLVDASEEMIRECQLRYGLQGPFSYTQALFQDLKLEEKAYDLIVAGLSIHHLHEEEKKQLYQKVYAALAPGGFFSTSDLYIERIDGEFHYEMHLEIWEEMARSLGTPEEECRFLFQHHHDYDFPNHYRKHLAWLRDLDFRDVQVTWIQDYWGNIQARKI